MKLDELKKMIAEEFESYMKEDDVDVSVGADDVDLDDAGDMAGEEGEQNPEEALEKSIPSDHNSFGQFLKQVLYENKINTNRVAVCLPSDSCYTRLIEIPEEVEEENSKSYLENPNSGIQIPISLENSDFEINLSNLPKKEIHNKKFNK